MFKVNKLKNGDFNFKLYAKNKQILLFSESYTTKNAVLNTIESVKRNSLMENRFEKMVSSKGKFYFYLKAPNGQIVGTSNYYQSEASRDNGILSVMKNAPCAEIVIEL